MVREVVKVKEELGLGFKFKKIGVKKMLGMRIEKDSMGWEV